MTAFRRLRRAVLPSFVDELLYVARRGESLPAVQCGVPITFIREEEGPPRSGLLRLVSALGQRAPKIVYSGLVDGLRVHTSLLFPKVRLPELFGFPANVPCIGACETAETFRGKRIYPCALQHIVRDVFERTPQEQVYILVSPLNAASVRGIELAGFSLLSRLRGWRFGPFVLKRER